MPFQDYHRNLYGSDRQMFQQAELYADLIRGVCELQKEPLPHIICGTGCSGIPMATLIADRLQVGLCAIRSALLESTHDKSWGTGPDIHEQNAEGQYILRYLFVDDLIASGTTIQRMEHAIRRLYPWHYRKMYGIWLQDRYVSRKEYNVGTDEHPTLAKAVPTSEHIFEWKGRLLRNMTELSAREYCERKALAPIAAECNKPGVLSGVPKHETVLGQSVGMKEMDRLSNLTGWWG